MDFNKYQERARSTAFYPNLGSNFTYPVLGMSGEIGEVADKVKKIIRDNNSELTSENIIELKKELGDVLWYMANMCSELEIDFNDVAESNMQKLLDRKNRNVLSGSGDNR